MSTGRGAGYIAGGVPAQMMPGVRSTASESRFWFLWQDGVTTDLNTSGLT